jgi:nucleotide-binding universal stress UspA family protein
MLLKDCPVATLFSGDQRLPIRKILLIVQGDGDDVSSTKWAIRFARSSSAQLVVLPVMVPIPEMYVVLQHEHSNLDGLLACESPTSCAVRKVMHQLADHGFEVTLKIRNETSEWHICLECTEGDYDLVIIGAENLTWERKILVSDIVYPVYSKITSPLLVSKPGHGKD